MSPPLPTAGMLDVSVVIPVYNPGPFIEECVDGIMSQTMDPSRFEVIFVDDGSTDESPARLDELAEQVPNVRVFHEPPSGWPGRPRNVGIDNARGRYVFFNDHDDWLGPEALERMVAYADENHADICIPKMVGHNRPVPSVLFAEDRPDVTVMTAPLMSGLTPHKLFRREFLDGIGLRFPEGPRRLEDHVFVVEAYLRAARICVYSDYPCYHHIRRPDDGNAGTDRIEPVGYYANLREVLDVIDRYAEPGPVRDLVRARPYNYEILLRLRRTLTSSTAPIDYKLDVFREARKVVIERYEPEYDRRFPLLSRLRAQAIRQDRPDDLEALDRLSKQIGLNGQVTDIAVRENRWVASVHAVVILETAPFLFTPDGDDRWTADPRGLPEPLTSDRASLDLTVPTSEALGTKALATLNERTAGTEWFVSSQLETQLEPLGDPGGPHQLVVSGTLTFDPQILGGGGPLDSGIWDLNVRFNLCGFEIRDQKLFGGPELVLPEPMTFGDRPSSALMYLRDGVGTITLDSNGRKTRLISEAVRRGVGPTAKRATGWELALPIEVVPGSKPRSVTVTLSDGVGAIVGQRRAPLEAGASSGRIVFAHRLVPRRPRAFRHTYELGLRPRPKADPVRIGSATVNRRGQIVAIALDPPAAAT